MTVPLEDFLLAESSQRPRVIGLGPLAVSSGSNPLPLGSYLMQAGLTDSAQVNSYGIVEFTFPTAFPTGLLVCLSEIVVPPSGSGSHLFSQILQQNTGYTNNEGFAAYIYNGDGSFAIGNTVQMQYYAIGW